MTPNNRWCVRCVATAAAVILAGAGNLMAQGSGSSRATPSPPRQPTVDEFAASFWQFINRSQAPYQKWQMVETDVPEGIADEHQGPRTTYLNDVAGKDKAALPLGSILVRPDYSADGKTLQSVSVMYRVKSTDPTKPDWYWLRFQPDGKIARTDAAMGNRPLAGRVKSCVECHQKAPGGDFVFFGKAASDGERK